MRHDNLSYKEALTLLKLSIEFGVDEALSEVPQNRFTDGSKKSLSLQKNYEVSYKPSSNDHNQGFSEKSISSGDKNALALKYVRSCTSVPEIINAIKTFPYFLKSSENEEITYYQGASKPQILIFKEPEIYNIQSDKELKLFNKPLLFDRIFRSIEMTLAGKIGGLCASLVTFPAHFDKSHEKGLENAKLLEPFLFQYISVLKPKAVIFIGESLLDAFKKNEGLLNKNILDDIFVLNFPSLDVLRIAPKRKQDIWNKILELKKLLCKEA
tara:strand:- start:58 stop:864 length:807 start_codon:yes stop_codon:yes gene_type:complete